MLSQGVSEPPIFITGFDQLHSPPSSHTSLLFHPSFTFLSLFLLLQPNQKQINKRKQEGSKTFLLKDHLRQ